MEVKAFTYAPAGWRPPAIAQRHERVIAGCVLAAGDLLLIENGARSRVRVDDGLVCLTEQGGFTDLFVGAQESCRIDCDGLALVAASRESRVVVLADDACAPDCIDVRRAGRLRADTLSRRPVAAIALRALARALARLRRRLR